MKSSENQELVRGIYQKIISSLPDGTTEEEVAARLKGSIEVLTQALELFGMPDSVKTGSDEITFFFSGGVENTYRGKESFGHNPKWIEAKNKVWKIEGDMKLAAQGHEFYDEDGEEVPPAKVNTKPGYLKFIF